MAPQDLVNQPHFDLMGSIGEFTELPLYQGTDTLGKEFATVNTRAAPEWTQHMQDYPGAPKAPVDADLETGTVDQGPLPQGPGAANGSDSASFLRSTAGHCEAAAATQLSGNVFCGDGHSGQPPGSTAPFSHEWVQYQSNGDPTLGGPAWQEADPAIAPQFLAPSSQGIGLGSQLHATSATTFSLQNGAVDRLPPSLLRPTPVAFDGGLRLRFHVVA